MLDQTNLRQQHSGQPPNLECQFFIQLVLDNQNLELSSKHLLKPCLAVPSHPRRAE